MSYTAAPRDPYAVTSYGIIRPDIQRARIVHQLWESAIADALDSDEPRPEGKRLDTYCPTTCRCRIPEPMKRTADIAICTKCNVEINVDSAGVPYRRWPGDITTRAMEAQRQAEHAKIAMLAIVRTLPTGVQQRLTKLAHQHPHQFEAEARRIITAGEQANVADAIEKHPNTMRRAAIQRDSLADIADEVIARRRAEFIALRDERVRLTAAAELEAAADAATAEDMAAHVGEAMRLLDE